MAKKTIAFERKVPVRHEVDVLVVGGGPAGVAAAVAAARQGRKVFLAEGQSSFGGMGTLGLVPAFMTFGDGVHFLAAGIGQEILERLVKAGGVPSGARADKKAGSIGIRAEVLKRVYDETVQEAGVAFAFHTTLIGVQTAPAGKARSVTEAVFAAKSGLFAVRAKMYVDATGDGDLAARAGAPFEKGDAEGNLMPGTLCSTWAQVDWTKVRTSGMGAGNSQIERAFADGVFTYKDRHLPGMWRIGERLGGGNIGHTFGVDATDERSLTKALLWGRKSLLEYDRYYRTYLKGFEKMELVATGALLGVRETRRILGDYVLCLEDFKKRAVFADEIGRYCYPVDIHASKPDAKHYKQFEKEFRELRYKRGESYGVPYRCLVPKKLTNVLVSGRCVSSDRYIQGSIRVMPGCYITGQACGVAAALAVAGKTDTRGVDAAALQADLKKLGAYLPNAKA